MCRPLRFVHFFFGSLTLMVARQNSCARQVSASPRTFVFHGTSDPMQGQPHLVAAMRADGKLARGLGRHNVIRAVGSQGYIRLHTQGHKLYWPDFCTEERSLGKGFEAELLRGLTPASACCPILPCRADRHRKGGSNSLQVPDTFRAAAGPWSLVGGVHW